jgi:hypothetical protein
MMVFNAGATRWFHRGSRPFALSSQIVELLTARFSGGESGVTVTILSAFISPG